eukprot:SAG11_NODE_37720_length_255_cov_1.307692_1_plen_26_part_10
MRTLLIGNMRRGSRRALHVAERGGGG